MATYQHLVPGSAATDFANLITTPVTNTSTRLERAGDADPVDVYRISVANGLQLARRRTTAGEPVTIEHRHTLRDAMTTRRIIPGVHHLELQINGRTHATAPFTVTAPTDQSPPVRA
jgi:hypothetical protein